MEKLPPNKLERAPNFAVLEKVRQLYGEIDSSFDDALMVCFLENMEVDDKTAPFGVELFLLDNKVVEYKF